MGVNKNKPKMVNAPEGLNQIFGRKVRERDILENTSWLIFNTSRVRNFFRGFFSGNRYELVKS